MCKVKFTCPDCPTLARWFIPCRNLLDNHIRKLQQRIDSYKRLLKSEKTPKQAEEKRKLERDSIWCGGDGGEPKCAFLDIQHVQQNRWATRCAQHSSASKGAKKETRDTTQGDVFPASSYPRDFATQKRSQGSNSTNHRMDKIGGAAEPIRGRRLQFLLPMFGQADADPFLQGFGLHRGFLA